MSQLSGASTPADSNDFIIKEHTYTMCPGCPTFSIPIPIPKSTLKQQSVGDTLTKTGPGGYPTYDSKVYYRAVLLVPFSFWPITFLDCE